MRRCSNRSRCTERKRRRGTGQGEGKSFLATIRLGPVAVNRKRCKAWLRSELLVRYGVGCIRSPELEGYAWGDRQTETKNLVIRREGNPNPPLCPDFRPTHLKALPDSRALSG